MKSAKDIALNLLSYSPRSEQELSNKLKAKGFDKETIARVLEDLKQCCFIDDKRFAVEWARAKFKNRLWGSQKILNGLLEKGIAKETVLNAIKELDGEINEEETIKKAFEKWLKLQGHGSWVTGHGSRKLKTTCPLSLAPLNMAKAFRHLTSKGFQPSLVNQVLKKHYTEGIKLNDIILTQEMTLDKADDEENRRHTKLVC